MSACPKQSRPVEIPCVSTRLEDEAVFVGEMRAVRALQDRLSGILAAVARRLKRAGPVIQASCPPQRRLLS